MSEVAISGAPKCARMIWCDLSNIFLEIPHVNGGPPFIMKFPLSQAGLSSALELLRDARDKALPKGGHYSIQPHPAVKRDVSNKVAHDILKKLRMI